MKTNHKIYKTLCIDITTYKTDCKNKRPENNMNAVSLDKHIKSENKFICSICLNQKCVNDVKGPELGERKSRSCPICQCSCSYSTDDDSTLTRRPKPTNNINVNNEKRVMKNVQTSHADVTQGLNLLNEVLNAFQNRKQLKDPQERKSKTVIFKDVGVSTEDIMYENTKPKLSMSKVFHCSVESNNAIENKFTIVSSRQPDLIFVLHKSLDLINHKSSSIPQMKLEELKKSLKKKSRSKDAIEEANRIFATVKRVEESDITDNRPMIRSGPRVLPVVRTGNVEDNYHITDNHNPNTDQGCKPCQENNYHMSGGDSSIKNQCCNNCRKNKKTCDECIYTTCNHYQQDRQQAYKVLCKRCRMAK